MALTRAKRGLIVVGDPRTLEQHELWGDWLRWAKESGFLVPPEVIRPMLTKCFGSEALNAHMKIKGVVERKWATPLRHLQGDFLENFE